MVKEEVLIKCKYKHILEQARRKEACSNMRVSNVTVRKRLIFYTHIGYTYFHYHRYSSWICAIFSWEYVNGSCERFMGRNITFEPERGKILDRNGVELATNKSAPTVFVVPGKLKNQQRLREVSCSIRCGKR